MTFNYFTNIVSTLLGRSPIKAGVSDAVVEDGASDDDVERKINMQFVRNANASAQWYRANNDTMASIVQTQISGVIGEGINIQSRLPGMEETNNEIEDLIKEFSEAGMCEITGRFHLNSALRAMVGFKLQDGGFLVKHHYDKRWSMPYKFELIPVSMIDLSKYDESTNTLNGLEKDKNGKITAIWIFASEKRVNSVRVPMKNMIYHAEKWLSLTQYTAITKLAAIIPSIEKLDKYVAAELDAAVERAKSGVFWKTTLYDDILKIMRQNKEGTENLKEIKEIMKKISKQGIKPYGSTPIPREDDIVTEKRDTDTIFESLSKNTRNSTSSAVGMGGLITGQDASGANYSAMKGVLGMTEVNWAMQFDDLKVEVLEPIMRELIKAGVTIGRIKINDFFQSPRKYYRLEYMRQVSIDIEPGKTAVANEKNLKNGLTSQREIARKKGRNIEDIHREQIEDEIRYEKMRREMYAKEGLEIPENTDGTNN